jgi:hypothetical protein
MAGVARAGVVIYGETVARRDARTGNPRSFAALHAAAFFWGWDAMAVAPIINLRHAAAVVQVDVAWNLVSPTAIGTSPADRDQVFVAAAVWIDGRGKAGVANRIADGPARDTTASLIRDMVRSTTAVSLGGTKHDGA